MTQEWAQTVTDRVRAMLAAGSARPLVAIDGRCAAGKTILAEMLGHALNAAVLHMDGFYLQDAQRTPAPEATVARLRAVAGGRASGRKSRSQISRLLRQIRIHCLLPT